MGRATGPIACGRRRALRAIARHVAARRIGGQERAVVVERRKSRAVAVARLGTRERFRCWPCQLCRNVLERDISVVLHSAAALRGQEVLPLRETNRRGGQRRDGLAHCRQLDVEAQARSELLVGVAAHVRLAATADEQRPPPRMGHGTQLSYAVSRPPHAPCPRPLDTRGVLPFAEFGARGARPCHRVLLLPHARGHVCQEALLDPPGSLLLWRFAFGTNEPATRLASRSRGGGTACGRHRRHDIEARRRRSAVAPALVTRSSTPIGGPAASLPCALA